MSEPIQIAPGEHGVVRVFVADLTPEEARAFDCRDGDWPLQKALGARIAKPEALAFFDVAVLEGVGLASYLEDGQGVDPEQVEPARRDLEDITGHVLVLPSSALAPEVTELNVSDPLELVATLAEHRPPVIYEDLPGYRAGQKLSKHLPSMGPATAGSWQVMLGALTIALIIGTAVVFF